MKIVYFYLILSLLILNLFSCSNKQEITKATKATVSQYSEYGEDFLYIANELKAMISSENDVEFDCENLEKCIYFTIWREGIAMQAINAKKADVTSLDYWNKNLENYGETAVELYDYALQLGLKSKPFRFAVLNEKNKENILALFENGKKIYDYVNDSKQ